MKKKATGLGKRIHALRQKEGLTQAALAARLGISPSYLNLIENDRRPLSANLLIRLAKAFDIDLRAFAPGEDAKLVSDSSMEAFGDPLFEERKPTEGGGPRVRRRAIPRSPARCPTSITPTPRPGARRESIAAQVLDRQDLTGVDRARARRRSRSPI